MKRGGNMKILNVRKSQKCSLTKQEVTKNGKEKNH